MKIKLMPVSLSLATILLGSQAFADPRPLPRGSEIESLAGNCAIGPFEQTSKAGHYNNACATLTDAEKCLAFVKQHFNSRNGEVRPAYEQEKMAFCLDTFRSELLGN